MAEHASSDEKPRVLIVDDDPDERRLRRRQLDPAFEIQEAGDAQAAFRLIEQQRFDVVMLDVVMPGTSGIDACRAIKAAARERDELLPVLLVTGLDAPDDRYAGLEAGADDFLTKPVDRRELLLRVRAFARLGRQYRVIRQQMAELRDLTALKDDLVSLIVHDLRNPLSSIMGSLQILEEDEPEGERREPLIAAERAGRQMSGLLEDMLQIRLLEENRLVPSR